MTLDRDDIGGPLDWLPPGKTAAVVFTVDDVHPGTSDDPYEAGGDLGDGALGNLEWLLDRHPDLRATLFVIPDWREIRAFPSRRVLALMPWLRDRMFLTRVHPRGTMRVDRHPRFAAYLRNLPRTDVALHGLHHVHRGANVPVEFQTQDSATIERMLRRGVEILEAGGLDVTMGMTPPGWNLTPELAEAMTALRFSYVASARDVLTPITPDARTAMSGLRDMSLIMPETIMGGRMVHFTTNFQATSESERAHAVIEAGGLLAIKAHIVKLAFGYLALDGLDHSYRNYLDCLFACLEDRYGSSLWWTSMAEVADAVLERGDKI